jgi:hypothetical protein
MNNLRPAVSVALLLLCAGRTDAQPSGSGAPVVEKVGRVQLVSGSASEADFANAEPLSSFVQREPSEGTPATYPTQARVVADASAFHVIVEAVDPDPEKIVGYLTRRDVDSPSDWIHIFIDSYHDRRTGYQFAVNAAGVKLDSYWYNDDNSDNSWDAVWDVNVARTGTGWRAEFRIPYSQLRFASGGDGKVGFAVLRYVPRLNETSSWPLIARSVNGLISQLGELDGVSSSRSSKRLELLPYTVATVATEPPQRGNPLHKTVDPNISAGLDLKYAVTPALSLTATVNPDFGQVEADPAVVNLSAFETFFQERRPFFIEGSGTYRWDCNDDCILFYSRRIGRQPRGSPTLGADEYSVQPIQTTIVGAGKLTGRVGAFSVGSLIAATEEESANVALGNARRAEIVEPASFFSVSRVRREFADQSSLGFMLTTTTRRLSDSVAFMPDKAVTGGVDYDWRIGRRFSLNGYWAGSTVHGSRDAIARLQRSNVHSFQRPDAEHVEFDPTAEELNGDAGAVNFSKISGERTRFNFTASYKSPAFDVNDLGFMQRADVISQYGWLQMRWEKPGKRVRDYRINFNYWSSQNFDGDRLSLGGNFNAHWAFVNNWNTGFGVNANPRGFDDRRTRGGPGGYGNNSYSIWNYLNTDGRKKVRFGVDSSYGTDGHGEGWSLAPNVTVKATAALSAEFGISLNRTIEDSQWVEAVERDDHTSYVFGRLYQTTTSMTTRVNYTLTPNLSLQVYAQPFVSAGDYENFRELVNGRARHNENRYAPFAYGGNPDFRFLSFRTTNVMRWEFKPGSTLFVVWQQGRERSLADGTFSFGRDYGYVFDTPSTNTVLVKLAYWFNP